MRRRVELHVQQVVRSLEICPQVNMTTRPSYYLLMMPHRSWYDRRWVCIFVARFAGYFRIRNACGLLMCGIANRCGARRSRMFAVLYR